MRAVGALVLNVLGYDVELLLPTALSKKRVWALLGKHGIGAARGKPVITVELVANADIYEAGGALHRPGLLLGLGFALDYQRKRLLYPENSPLLQHMKNLGMQNPLTRAPLFSASRCWRSTMAPRASMPARRRPPPRRFICMPRRSSRRKARSCFAGRKHSGKRRSRRSC